MTTFRSPPPPRRPRFERNLPPDQHRINDRITAREVRLISDTGEQLGILAIRDALTAAESKGLDLVEVSPEAKPPVCRLMDYGKFKYREQKKKNEAKKKQTENTIKELRIRYRTDKGDLEIKLRQAREFLTAGDKVKFVMRFKGREVMYLDIGLKKFAEIEQALADVGKIDDKSPPYGKQIHVLFVPK